MTQRSCVVIGAGLAGLSAAYALAKRKWEVTVLEAREWTGGRVYSFRFPQAAELVCELGGEWVGKDHDAVIGLCKELGLNLMWHRFDFSFATSGRRG
jgi:monoamine oxidase